MRGGECSGIALEAGLNGQAGEALFLTKRAAGPGSRLAHRGSRSFLPAVVISAPLLRDPVENADWCPPECLFMIRTPLFRRPLRGSRRYHCRS